MNWRLIFSGLKSPGWTAYAVVGVALAVFLSLWLLRLERKLVSRRVGWTLMLLRMLVLTLLLLTLLQPVLTKQFDLEQRGRIVLAIDGSESMETQDRHASLAEKLRWAQALGMLGSEETRPLIDQWVADAEAGREPNWLGRETPPATPTDHAAADARARQVLDSLQAFNDIPRVEFIRRLLEAQPSRLLDKLDDVMPVDIRLFGAEQQSADAVHLAALLQSDREGLAPGATDVLQLLQTVTTEEHAGQVRGVVLLTDGRQTRPGDSDGTASRLANLGVPVFSVPIGSMRPPRDLSIAALDAPEAVFLNDKAEIRSVLGTSGFEGETLTVRLERDGQLIEQQTITPATDTATVTFAVPSAEAGRFDYRLITDVQSGELREDNNARDVSLHVVDNKARVMLLEGDARWEFRYLRNLLERDKQVETQAVLFHQPYLALLNDSLIPDSLPAIDAFREQLGRTDLLIIGDVPPDEIDAGIWDIVEQAVTRDGLTVVVVPGRRSMPQEHVSETLANLLPLTAPQQWLAEQLSPSQLDAEPSAFRLSLTSAGESMPMLMLSPDPALNAATLAGLPGHPWLYSGTPKPGATVWATATINGVARDPEPAIIHHDYGFGQVLWIGIDSTWRWRRRAGDEWHYRFWGQLIRWAARNKAAAGNDDVRLSLSDVVLDDSQSAEAVVRWSAKLLPQLDGAIVEVVATQIDAPQAREAEPNAASQAADQLQPEAVVVAATVVPSQEAPERFSGRLPRLAPGTWRVEVRVTGGAVSLTEPVATEVFVRQQVSAELANVSCHRELLKRLSDLSGGKLVEPWDADQLVSLIQPRDQAEQKIDERTLWDHWLLLPAFFTLLMAEWVLRKLHGLP